MRSNYKAGPSLGLTAVLLIGLSAYSYADQTASSNYEPALNSLGHPDIQGVWDFRTLTPLERPAQMADSKAIFTQEEAEAFRQQVVQRNDVDNQRDIPAEFDVEGAYNSAWWDFGTTMTEDRRTSLIVDPSNGRLPALTPETLLVLKENDRRLPPVRDMASLGMSTFRPDGPESVGLSERCLAGFNAGPPLSPSAYNNNLRIVQTPDHVVLVTEMIHNARVVPMDGRPHLPKDLAEWSGDARGHWEGNTLVVETKNFTNKIPVFQLPFALDKPGKSGAVGFGKNFQLTERFTPVNESRLLYEYTIDDPTTFTQPFTVVIPMKASDNQMFEYACHEGNYSMPGMLNGARQAEKEELAAH